MDDLWPDLDPDSAANSLNQTLYFLRRDIDPWYEDGVSANYVVYESELMWLDCELASVDSIEFRDQSRRAIADGADLEAARSALKLYRGRFAPEFEYEDWAMAWRDGLHATYLHLAETTVSRMCESGLLRESAELCQLVLGIEPAAESVERALVWTYGRIGAASAATEQYQHLARSIRQALGVEPPSLRDVLETPPWATTASSQPPLRRNW
jgi:two-component SAPR family response regulator